MVWNFQPSNPRGDCISDWLTSGYCSILCHRKQTTQPCLPLFVVTSLASLICHALCKPISFWSRHEQNSGGNRFRYSADRVLHRFDRERTVHQASSPVSSFRRSVLNLLVTFGRKL